VCISHFLIYATCSAHLALRDLIPYMVFSEEYKLSSSIHNFLSLPVNCPILERINLYEDDSLLEYNAVKSC
jgi:hypothetical protein